MKALKFVLLGLLCLVASYSNSQDFSLSFDGNDSEADHVMVNTFADGATGELTIEAWVKVDALKAGYMTITDFSGDNPYFGFNGNDLVIYMASSGTPVARQDFTPFVGVWTHVATTISNGDQKLYINGTEVSYMLNGGGTLGPGTATFTAAATSFGIGRFTGSDPSFDGTMDEVRVWNDVRTSGEISTNYNVALTGSEGNLVAYYDFNEGTGTTLGDLAGTPEPGTLLNGATNTPAADGTTNGPIWSTDAPLTIPNGTSIATGLWSAPSTWANGVIPGSADDVIIQSGHTVTLDQNIDIDGLQVDGDLNTSNFNLLISGDYVINGLVTFSGNETLTFDGSTGGALTFNPNPIVSNYPDVFFTPSASTVYVVTGGGWNFAADKTISISGSGQVDISGQTVGLTGASSGIVQSGASLLVGSAGLLRMSNGATYTQSGGSFIIQGTPGSEAFVQSLGGGWSFSSTGGGVIAEHFFIQNLQGNGMEFGGTSFVGPPYFTDGSFEFGTGTAYLTFNNTAMEGFTSERVVFDSGPTYSVQKLAGTGTITFSEASGALSGDGSENEASGTIDWTFPENALDFDGIDDYVQAPDIAALDLTTALTMEAWVKIDEAPTGTYSIISKFNPDATPPARSYSLFIGNDLNLAMGVSGDGVNIGALFGEIPLQLGTWHHVAGVFSPGQLVLYVDGNEAGTTTTNIPSTLYSGSAPLTFGTSSNTAEKSPGTIDEAVNMNLDEVRIWNQSLNQSELQANMFNSLTGSEPNLVAYYDFNVSSGNTLADLTSNNNDATLFNNNDNTPPADGETNGPLWTSSGAFQLTPRAYPATKASINGFQANWLSIPNAVSVSIELLDQGLSNIGTFSPTDPLSNSFFINQDLAPYFGQRLNYRIQYNDGVADSPLSQTQSFMVGAGNSLPFNGVDQYVNVPDNASLEASDVVTLTAWVQRTDFTTLDVILEKGGGWSVGETNYAMALHNEATNNGMFYFFWDGGFIGTDGVSDYEWHHYAVVANETSDQVSLYIDGDLKSNIYSGGSSDVILNESTTRDLHIGAQIDGGATYYGNAFIDEVQIWDIERFGSEIQPAQYRTLIGNESGLLAYYRFDEVATTGTLPDLSVNGNVGSLTNMTGDEWFTSGAMSPKINLVSEATTAGYTVNWETTLHGNGNILLDVNTALDFSGTAITSGEIIGNSDANKFSTLTTLAAGTRYYARIYIEDGDFQSDYSVITDFFTNGGNALQFDEVGDYVLIPDNPALDVSTGTVEAWVRTTANDGSFRSIVVNNPQYGMWTQNGQLVTYDEGIMSPISSGTFIADGNWHHVAFAWEDGTTSQLYVDGLPAGSSFNYNSLSSLAQVHIGANVANQFWNGEIDEVRIWNRKLSDTEIQSHVFTTLSGDEEGLVAYYRFDEGEAAADNTPLMAPEISDLTGNGFDGSMFGFTRNGSISNWIGSGALSSASSPIAPSDLIAYRSSETEITLEWSDNANDETEYIIEGSADEGFGSPFLIDNVPANITTYIYNAGADTPLYYRVTASNGNGTGVGEIEFATTEIHPGTAISIGSNQRFDLANDVAFDATEITVEAWVNTTDTNLGRVAVRGSGGNQRWSLNTNWSGFEGKAAAVAVGSTSAIITSSTDINDGNWHHIAGTYNLVTGYVQIYVDGVLEGNGSFTGAPLTADFTTIGNWEAGTNQPLDGDLDELRIWSTIKTDFSDRFQPLQGNEANLIAYYPFDENTTNTTLIDRSRTTFNGTPVSSPAYTGSGAISPSNLQVFEISPNQIDLSWVDNTTNETGFVIERALVSDFSAIDETTNLGANETSYTDLSVVPSTTYYYRVRAELSGAVPTGFTNVEEASTYGVPGNALDFAGGTDYVQIENIDFSGANQPFTIETWVRNTDNTRYLLTFNQDGSSDNTYALLDISGGNGRFLVRNPPSNTGGGSVVSTTSLNDGQWHHLAGVYDGVSSLEIWVDGVMENSNTSASPTTGYTVDLRMGRNFPNGTNQFNGQLDEVRIWNTVKSDFSDRFTKLDGSEAGLLAYYDFDQGTPDGNNTGENVLIDRTVNGYNGSLVSFALNGTTSNWVTSGAMTPSSAPAAPTDLVAYKVSDSQIDLSWVDVASDEQGYRVEVSNGYSFSSPIQVADLPAGTTNFSHPVNEGDRFFYRVSAYTGALSSSSSVEFATTDDFPGRSLEFDGVDDYVDLGPIVTLQSASQFAIELWFKFSEIGEYSILSNQPVGAGGGGTILSVGSSSVGDGLDDITVFLENGATTYATTMNDFILPNEWYHLAISYDGSGISNTDRLKLYVDGVELPLTFSGTIPATTSSTTNPFAVGSKGGVDDYFIHGNVDEVRIWSSARTQTEIQNNLYTRFQGNEAGLVAYYSFDEDGGNTAVDMSVNALDGSINGAQFDNSEFTQPSDFYVVRLDDQNVQLNWSDNWDEDGFRIFTADDFDGANGSVLITLPANQTSYTHNIGTNASSFYLIEAFKGTEEIAQSTVEFGTTTGFPGFAMAFDGTGDQVIGTEDVGILGNTPRTLEFWYRHGTNAGGAVPVNWGGNTPSSSFGFWTNVNDLLFYGEQDDYNTGYTFTDNDWHHLAATYDGSTVRTYVDGVETPTSAIAKSLVTTDGPLYVGSEANNTNFSVSDVDEIRIWTDSVKLDFSDRFSYLTGNEPKLAVYHSFDENSNAAATKKVVDRSLETKDADLFGDPQWITSNAGLPEAPTNLTAFVDNFLQPQLDWDDTPGALSYVVERSQGDNTNYTQVGTPTSSDFNDGTVPDDGDIYYYRVRAFDGNNNSDISNEVIADIKGPGNALFFNGIAEAVSIDQTTSLSPGSGDYTMAFWFNINSISASQQVLAYSYGRGGVSGGAGGDENDLFGFVIDTNGELVFNVRDAADATFQELRSGLTLQTGEWYHAAATIDRTSVSVNMYLNGRLIVSNPLTEIGTIDPGNAITIGASELLGSIGYELFFDGTFDDLKIWNAALTENEIRSEIYTPDLTNGALLGYWDLDQASGTTVYDIAGLNNGVTINMTGDNTDWVNSQAYKPFIYQVTDANPNSFTANWLEVSNATGYHIDYGTDQSFASFNTGYIGHNDSLASVLESLTPGTQYFARISYEDGNYISRTSDVVNFYVTPGYTIDLDGTDDQFDLTPNLDQIDFDAPATIEFWYQPDNDHKSNGDIIFSMGTGSQNFYITYGEASANITNERISAAYSLSGSDVTLYGYTDAGTFTGEWHHYAVVMTGTEYLFYIDGVQVTASASSWPNNNPGFFGDGIISTEASLGSFKNTSNYSDGRLDEFRLWNDVRSPEEISENIYSKLVGNEEGLVAYYRFDHENNSLLSDLSLNQNDGTWNGTGGANAAPNWLQSTAFSVENFIVSNTAATGTGSLAQAIQDANASSADFIEITFDIPGNGPWVISPSGSFTIDNVNDIPVLIDARTQPGYDFSAGMMVTLDGSGAASFTNAFNVQESNVEIYGFNIFNYVSGTGIRLNGDAFDGQIVGENVITGLRYGIYVDGSDNVVIQGNYIGIQSDGTTVSGNSVDGIYIVDSDGSLIGGDRTQGEGNVICGNGNGIQIEGMSTGFDILGNLIGLAPDGITPAGNSLGIFLRGSNARIGGSGTGQRNYISGNSGNGIGSNFSEAAGSVISFNTIGLGTDGSIVGNGGGIDFWSSATGITIDHNVISGNNGSAPNGYGVYIDSGPNNITISNNYIGTDPGGTLDRGNTSNGVIIRGCQSIDIIDNLISGNGGDGIQLSLQADNNTIQGNFIGTDYLGTGSIPNADDGIFLNSGPSEIQIGGTGAGEGNIISYNSGDGIQFTGSTTVNNNVVGNRIFCNDGLLINFVSGAVAGIESPVISTFDASGFTGTATENTGTISIYESTTCTSSDINQMGLHIASFTISDFNWTYNGGADISKTYVATFTSDATGTSEPVTIQSVNSHLDDLSGSTLREAITASNSSSAFRNHIFFGLSGNYTIAPTTELPSLTSYVVIDGSTNAFFDFANGDLITVDGSSCSGCDGFYANNSSATLEIYGLRVQNFINGIMSISGTAPSHIIGAPGRGNIVVNNSATGIYLDGFNDSGITVQSNLVGIEHDGTAAGNNYGIRIFSTHTLVGGELASERNVVAASGITHLYFDGASNSRILGNYLGTNLDATNSAGGLGSGQNGVFVAGNTDNVLIKDNVISSSGFSGILFQGGNEGEQIIDNFIGTSGDGSVDLGNTNNGLYFDDAFAGLANNNVIRGNTIAHNDGYAVLFDDVASVGNEIRNNSIFDNTTGGISGGSGGLVATPTVQIVTPSEVSGVAVAMDTVEVFIADILGQGQSIIDSVEVAGDGTWSLTGLILSPGTDIVATTTNTLNGTSSFSTPLSLPERNSLNFDGSDDFVEIAHDPLISFDGDFGFGAWFYLESIGPSDFVYLISKRDLSDFQNPIAVGLSTRAAEGGSSGMPSLYALVGDGSSGLNLVTSNSQDLIGSWHHVFVTMEGTQFRLYLDGVEVDNVTYSGTRPQNTERLEMGGEAGYPTSYFDGFIDDVQIWNASKSLGEINAFMNATLTGEEENLVAYYDFEVCSGSVLPDLSGNNLSGTLTNFDFSIGSDWDRRTSLTGIPPAVQVSGIAVSNVLENQATISWTPNDGEKTIVFLKQTASTEFEAPAASTTYLAATDFGAGTELPPNFHAIYNGYGSSVTVTNLQELTDYRVLAFSYNDCASSEQYLTANTEGQNATNFQTVKLENALDFDGTDQVSVAASVAEGQSDLTVEAWIYPTAYPSTDQTRSIVTDGNYASGQGTFALVLTDQTDTDYLAVILRTDEPNEQFALTDASNVPLNQWTHVAFSWTSGGAISTFINGTEVANTSSSLSGSTATSVDDLIIGSNTNGAEENFIGLIDEVRIWNLPKDEQAVRDDMFTEFTGPVTNLLANYNFNEGIPSGDNSGTTTTTDISLGNDGDISSFNLTGGTSNYVNSTAFTSGTGQIVLTGNSQDISDSNTPVTSDGTHLGITADGSPLYTTLTIENRGTGPLVLDNLTPITVSGTGFSLYTPIGNTTIPAFGSESFDVEFFPSTPGSFAGTVQVFDDMSSLIYTVNLEAVTYPQEPGSGYALSFNGTSDLVDAGDDPLVQFGTNDFTIEGWFYFDGNAQLSPLVQKRVNASPFNQYFVSISNGNAYSAADGNVLTAGLLPDGRALSNVEDRVISSIPLTVGWHHFALVQDYDFQAELFLDGVSQGTSSANHNGKGLSAAGASLLFGSNSAGEFYGGSLDEIKIWNRTRTELEIRQDLAQKVDLISLPSGLIAYYRFDENGAIGSTLVDLTGNLDGTINGASPQISGARVGDESAFTTTTSVALSGAASGNNLTVNNILGAPDVTYIYRVNEAPNNTIIPAGMSSLNTTDYYGVFTAGGTNPTFNLQWFYAGNPDAASNENGFRIAYRPDNTEGTFVRRSSFFDLNTTADQLIMVDQTSGEFIQGVSPQLPTQAFPGTALNFDGSADRIDVPDNSKIDNASQLTIEAWVNPASNPGTFYTFVDKYEGPNRQFVFGMNSSGALHVETSWNGASNGVTSAVSEVTVGEWHHYAAVIEPGTGITLYKDGQLLSGGGSFGDPAVAFTANNANLSIGYTPTFSYDFNGSLDEIRIWDGALSQGTIDGYYQQDIDGSHPNLSDLVAFYKFDEGIADGNNTGILGPEIEDYAENGLAGTMSGFLKSGTSSNWVTSGATTQTSFTVTNTANAGAGSLRQAILDAQNATSQVLIDFDLPGDGSGTSWTIVPSTELPTVLNFNSQKVILDATTQNGWDRTMDQMVVIEDAGSLFAGLDLDGSEGVEVYGLKIRGFDYGIHGFNVDNAIIGATGKANVISGNATSGIRIEYPNNNVISYNYIGTDVLGTSADPNGIGIDFGNEYSEPNGNTISYNVISGNTNAGIYIGYSTNYVQFNKIGVNDNVNAAIPNGTGVVLGGNVEFDDNIVGGNTIAGITLMSPFANINEAILRRNFIGLSPIDDPIPNGIGINSVPDANIPNPTFTKPIFIGEFDPATGNTMAYNTGAAIELDGGAYERVYILNNSFYQNGDQIQLINGADAGQSSPIISTVTTTDIDGSHQNDVGDEVRIYLYESDPLNPLQGRTVLDSVRFSGSQTFNFTGSFNPSLDYAVQVTTLDKGSSIFGGLVPTISITTSETDPTNNNSIPITVTFSEEVTGFVAGDVVVSGGTISAFNTSDNIIFNFNLDVSADGLYMIDIPAAVCQDLDGNDNVAAPQFAIDFDGTSPTPTITSTEDGSTILSPFNVTVSWDEDVANFVGGDVTVTNGSVTDFLQNTPSNYTVEITPLGPGTVNIDIATGVAEDLVTNPSLAATQFSIDYVIPDPLVVYNGNDNGLGSLREVVTNASANDIITFDPGVDWLTTTVELNTEIAIDKALTIDGANGPITINQNGTNQRIFDISEGTNANPTELRSLILQGGNGVQGGAVNISGTGDKYVNIVDVFFTGNSAGSFDGGALLVDFDEVVFVTNSTLYNNSAENGGGIQIAAGGSVTLINSSISNNIASNQGGGINQVGNFLDLINSTVAQNTANQHGGIHMTGAVGSVAPNPVERIKNSIILGNNETGPTTGDADIFVSSLLNLDEINSGHNVIGETTTTQTEFGANTLVGEMPGTHLGAVSMAGPNGRPHYPLLNGSVAVDFANENFLGDDGFDVDNDGNTAESLPIDAVGNVRYFGNALDVGSAESSFSAFFATLSNASNTLPDALIGPNEAHQAFYAFRINPNGVVTLDNLTIPISTNGLANIVNGEAGLHIVTGQNTFDNSTPVATSSVGGSSTNFTGLGLTLTADTDNYLWISVSTIDPITDGLTIQGTGNPTVTFVESVSQLGSAPNAFVGFTFQTPPAYPYCDPNATFSTTIGPLITNVTLDAINNSTGTDDSNFYNDFSVQTASLQNGNTHTLTVSVDDFGSGSGFLKVFADWDQDNIFEEVVGETAYVGVQILNLNLTIPPTAALGNTRLRVFTYLTAEPINGGCSPAFADGEVEDYTVNVLNGDFVAPVVTVADLTTEDRTPALSGTIDDATATIVVNVNGVNYNSATISGSTWTLADNTIESLTPATYPITVTATDPVSNVGNGTGTLIIEGNGPVITLSTTSTADLTPALSGEIDDVTATITITLNEETYNATNNGDGTWTLADNTIDSLDVGSYTVTGTGTDTFGNEGTFTSTLSITPSSVTANTAASLGAVSFVASWGGSFGGVSGYQLDVSTSLNFTSYVEGYESLAVTDTFQTVTGLDYTANYYYRVRVLYNSGDVSENSNTVTVTTATDPGTAQDSTALVNIYNSTGGSSWTDATNWLTGRLSTWQGVTMTEARITAVDLSSNNLTGAIGDITEGLDALTTLDLSDNQLTSIGSLTSLTSLTSADVSSNDLEFGSLENVRDQTTNLTFTDQGIALEAADALVEIGESFTIDRSISGSDNSYAWFRDNSSIDNTGGTLTVTPTSPADEGIFRAEVTNDNFPGLTITTADFELKVSSIERDQQALLNIYNTLDAANTWTNGADWPNNGDISTWVGVVVDPALNRVTELDLSGVNVIGDMPDDLQDIGGLTRLDLSNNEISRLPDISSLTLSQVNVSGNQLDFGDLEPNITILGGLENYNNQGLIGAEDREELIARGNDFTLTFTTGGTANTYSWTRLNALGSAGVGDGTNDVEIDNIRYENMGIFTVQVSNTIVPGLTLESHPINVFATARLDGDIVDENGDPLPEGSVQALRIPFVGEESRGYDSLDAIAVVNGSFTFGSIVLGDLLLSTRVEDGLETYLPTYFGNTDLFVDADTIFLRDDFSITGYQMQLNPPGFEPGDGDGEVGLGVESDFAEDRQQAREAGRLTARRKLQKVGCSLRRRRRATGGRDEGIANDDEFELVVYKETDEDGRVTFENLPPDTYRLNIEYPGIPMDPDSFIEFEVGEGGLENNTLQLEATVDENGIAVELVEELGFYRHYFKDLELYPNPVDRELTIRYSKLLSEQVRVQLLNLQGRLIKEERVGRGYNQEMVLDTQDVEEGIYLVRFIDPTRREGNNIVTYKIIVKRR